VAKAKGLKLKNQPLQRHIKECLVINNMKYLKLFEELKSETYNKVASKLKQMGHERRSKEMYDWSKVIQKKETYERWSKLGTFEMSFFQKKWNPSTKLSDHKHLFDGQFHIGLQLDSDYLWERLSEIQDNLTGDNLFILFFFGALPANEESSKKLHEYVKDDGLFNGGYWEANFSIKVSEKGFEILPKASAYYEEFQSILYVMSNRREAIKFHQLLVNLFEQKIELPVDWGNIQQCKSMIEEKTNDKNIWSRIVNSIKNMSLNHLYRD